jgi:dTDP-4-dehydrorhamnose 3,5-epimerase
MHFQVDEAAHEKLVYCVCGHVLDVVVDIRPDSPSFNKPAFVHLRADDSFALFVGKGYAHGFLSLKDDSLMIYQTSTVYNPALDKGVLWSSIDFDWPISSPILSARDLSHPSISDSK